MRTNARCGFKTAFQREHYLCWSLLLQRALFIGSLLQDSFQNAHECPTASADVLMGARHTHESVHTWSSCCFTRDQFMRVFLTKKSPISTGLCTEIDRAIHKARDSVDAALSHCFRTRALSMLGLFFQKEPYLSGCFYTRDLVVSGAKGSVDGALQLEREHRDYFVVGHVGHDSLMRITCEPQAPRGKRRDLFPQKNPAVYRALL